MHHHDHDHHSHIDPAFELAESDCHQCGEHSAPPTSALNVDTNIESLA